MVVPRQPKAEPNLLFIAYDLLKGRPDNWTSVPRRARPPLSWNIRPKFAKPYLRRGRLRTNSNTIQYNTTRTPYSFIS